MTEFRGDKMSLFLFLLLQFTAATEQNPIRVVVRDGGEVTLLCQNGIHHQDTCEKTSWLFNGQSSSVNLVTDGKIKENLKSDRLNVTENCSLLIRKVTVEDVGYYTCRASGYDTNVYLFLIIITEQENNDKKTLSCSMLGYGACDFMMSWLHEGKDVTEVKHMRTSESECSVSVTPSASYVKQQSKYRESFKCKVRHPEDREDHQFSFSPEKPGEEATTAATTTTTITLAAGTTITARAPEDSNNTRSDSTEPAKDDWWLYVVAAGGAALIVLVMIIVVVVRCKRTKGKKAQMDENTGEPLNPAAAESAPETRQDTADPDDGVSYASVSYIKGTNKAKVKNDDDEGDTVTYSTVRASPSAAAAAACDDPSSLYAAIKKPNK